MSQENDGMPDSNFSDLHRGFRIKVRTEGVDFIARVATTLAAASTRPLGQLEIHERDVAVSVIGARSAMELAKGWIDQLYDVESQMVERGAACESVKLPAWVSDEEFLKQRGEA